MTYLTLPYDDPDADRDELLQEQAIADAEQRGREMLLRLERERELAVAGDAEVWP